MKKQYQRRRSNGARRRARAKVAKRVPAAEAAYPATLPVRALRAHAGEALPWIARSRANLNHK